jgi:Leucine-rich repeat (LRR) protein
MNNKIKIEQGKYGTKAILHSGWEDAFISFFNENNVVELYLNCAFGWNDDNLFFLRKIPNLLSFKILNYKIKSLEGIESLSKLKSLDVLTYAKTPVIFSNFPQLETCGFEWIKGSDSIFESVNLKKLFINSYDKKSCDVFSKLINLEKLSILNAPIESLHGLNSLKKLNYLCIENLKKLTSFQGIEDLTELEELEVQRCKMINSISELSELKKLKRLLLLDMGGIESLKVLDNLNNLEAVLFYESTNIVDGDISPLTRLKKLSKVSFQNRKHYTHQREDFGIAYSK